ncbi:MAG: hypothetical protein ABWK15_09550 [Dissulfuribacterales bacterium]
MPGGSFTPGGSFGISGIPSICMLVVNSYIPSFIWESAASAEFPKRDMPVIPNMANELMSLMVDCFMEGSFWQTVYVERLMQGV